ncbi:MAG: histidine phosphatase family protein [Mobilibacterium timonense]|uniref:histidine phosphatase family protein n=1 Tax=Mobilibacterium timonense TaxID=1871012 RepID=UPI002353177E|nr:histidine phosphatase family protein [Mobilibacterium timonense]MBM6989820.1 histidine phosphatase family protein [Mobilibacterium timonense]
MTGTITETNTNTNTGTKNDLFLIRHGHTEGTSQKIFYGSTDLALTTDGAREIRELRDQGIYPSADHACLYTTGMLRTEQTFRLIFGDQPHGTIPELREINMGELEMAPLEKVMEHEPSRRWFNGETDRFDFPGGDSTETFTRRILKGSDKLMGIMKNSPGRDTILVCHGGVISALMELYFSGIRNNTWKWLPEPGHGYEISFRDLSPVDFTRI